MAKPLKQLSRRMLIETGIKPWRPLINMLLALTIVLALFLVGLRMRQDAAYRSVILCLDFDDLVRIAHQTNTPISQVLGYLKGQGLGVVAVTEGSLDAFLEKGEASEIALPQAIDLAAAVGANVRPGCRYLLTADNEIADSMDRRLSRVYDEKGYQRVTLKDRSIFAVPYQSEGEFGKLNLGIDLDEIKTADRAGFVIIPRVANNGRYGYKDVAYVLDELDAMKYGLVNGPRDRWEAVMFTGDQALGFPANIQLTAAKLAEMRTKLGWVEFNVQDGADEVARRLGASVLLTHSISTDELVTMTPEKAIDRFVRAVRERDVRILYVHAFFSDYGAAKWKLYNGKAIPILDKGSLLNFNFDYFKDIKAALESRGYAVARHVDRPDYHPPEALRTLLALGVIAWIIFALSLINAMRKRWYAVIAGVLALIYLAIALKDITLAHQAFAFLAAATAPIAATLAGLNVVSRRDVPPGVPRALLGFLYTSGLSLAGGLIIYGLMSDDLSMLKIVAFRGVTFAMALPVFILAAYLWDLRSFRFRETFSQRWRSLLDQRVDFGDILIVTIGLAALAVILLRSGNEAPLKVGHAESSLRQTLENLLSVRPRNKELIGHPFLVLFLAKFYRRTRPVLLFFVLGLLGQVSIVNTFCHFHTPVGLSLERALIGIAIGAVIGAAILLVELAYLRALKRRKA
jgi:hypothetical protein